MCSRAPPLPSGRGREAMTYGRGLLAGRTSDLDGAVVSHLAELVRGDFLAKKKGPLIRPSGTFSPRGEGVLTPLGQPETNPYSFRAAFTSSSGNRYFAPSSYFQFFMAPALPCLVVSPTQAPMVDCWSSARIATGPASEANLKSPFSVAISFSVSVEPAFSSRSRIM